MPTVSTIDLHGAKYLLKLASVLVMMMTFKIIPSFGKTTLLA